jgi:pilus assembly protein Flp/PilA
VLKIYIATRESMRNLQNRFNKDEGGATLIEYSVLIGLITVATIALIVAVGGWVVNQWTALNTALPAA